MDNVFYFKHISDIGGVETFFYYLSKLYKNMVVYYKEGDSKQVKRLAQNIEVRKFNNEPIKCKRFFCCYGFDIGEYLDAEEKYHLIHCNYKGNKHCKLLVYPGFKYIGVSQYVCDTFKELSGLDAELIYNPIAIDNPHVKKKTDKIHIVCATRLSGEKGGWRIDKFADLMDKTGIDYDLTVYTNRTNYSKDKRRVQFHSPNVIIKSPKLDIAKELQEATYVLQLSDDEAYGYTPVESAILGTTPILTDIPVFEELGFKHGKNCIIVDKWLENIDFDLIKKGIPLFKYTPPKSNWGKYLDNNREYDPNELIEVKVLKNKLWLVEEDLHLVKGDIVKLPRVRASELEAKNYVIVSHNSIL